MFGTRVQTDEETIRKVLNRRKDSVFPSLDDIVSQLRKGERLKFYLGIDPTGDLHIGHTIPLLLLKNLAELGHEAIVLIGDFTARIGDPTDKDATRKQLRAEEVENNQANYKKQFKKLFGKVPFTLRNNAAWLAGMNLEKIMDIASHVTVHQLLARDMFQRRTEQKKPIGLHEFLYPLLQGYDSVAMAVDGEVGGNDQTFNMLIGRDLEKAYLGKEKIVLGTRLLVDAQTNKKISKTEGSMISLKDSPRVIFEKVGRSIPNGMINTVFELCTEKEISWIEGQQKNADATGNFKAFNEELAHELVRMYYDEEAADHAREEYRKAAQGNIPDDAKRISHPENGHVTLMQFLSDIGAASSKSDAKRLIEQQAVQKNGEVLQDPFDKAVFHNGDIIRIGSGTYFLYQE